MWNNMPYIPAPKGPKNGKKMQPLKLSPKKQSTNMDLTMEYYAIFSCPKKAQNMERKFGTGNSS